jgi:hypothetical protein
MIINISKQEMNGYLLEIVHSNKSVKAKKTELTKWRKQTEEYIKEMESCLEFARKRDPKTIFFWHLGDRKNTFMIRKEKYFLTMIAKAYATL